MLQSIRDKTHGLIAGIIISILILSFALWGIHSYLDSGGNTNEVAKVNGVEISKAQLTVSYERLKRQLQLQNGATALPANAEATLKSQALQNLIDVQVLKQASLQQNYRISMDQVESLLESMPEFQVNDRFSMERFQQILSTTLFTANDFLDLLQTSLLIDQQRLGVIFSSFALPDEVGADITLINQQRDISYINLPVADFVKQITTIPADKIEAYYHQHQDEFKTAEQVSIEYIQLTVNDLMKQIHPTEADMKHFYNDNTTSFTEPGQWQLASILIPLSPDATKEAVSAATTKINDIQKQLKAGQSFEKLAVLNPGTALKLPAWVTINQAPAELHQPILSLSKPNQVMAAPVRTSQGLVLLKVIQIKTPQIQPYDKVKDKVSEAFSRQKAQEKFADLKEKLANITYEHPDSLKMAASELNVPIQTSGLFTKDKGNSEITNQTKIREAAFTPDVLNSQNNSDVIQLAPDSAVVLRITTHIPATVLPLKTVENQISEKLKVSLGDEATKQKAAEIVKKLSQGTSPESLSASDHVTWKEVGYIGRRAMQVDAAILDKAFSMPRPAAAMLAVYSFVKTPNGYAVIALKGVRDGDATKKDQREMFTDQIQNSLGVLEYALYKQSIINDAKIVIENPSTQELNS